MTILIGTIQLYDGINGDAIYHLGNYGLGVLVAEVGERDSITIQSVSKHSMTVIDFGYNWEHTIKDEM